MGTIGKVLIADDDLDLLNIMRKYVSDEFDPDEIFEANDGEEALELAESNVPDLILLDVMMPKQSGWEVCRALRAKPKFDQSKIVMLTGVGKRLNELTSPLYNADAYLDKPIDFDELTTIINDLLSS